jgi:hypothetical protein
MRPVPPNAPAFAKWQRLLSPEQYEIVEARTSRGARADLIATHDADYPLPTLLDYLAAPRLSVFFSARSLNAARHYWTNIANSLRTSSLAAHCAGSSSCKLFT